MKGIEMEDLTKFSASACAERMAIEGDIQAERIILDLLKQRAELLEALKSIQSRINSCKGLPISALEIFDSFFQEVIDEAIANSEK